MPWVLKYDLTGMRFGFLSVIKQYDQRNSRKLVLWECICDCGNTRLATTGDLRHGGVKSCGCWIPWKTHGDWNKRIRVIWVNMIRRCSSPTDRQYKDYGGRGITVCDEWKDYLVFREWAYNNGYADHLTIERKEVNKGYSPDSCTWATPTQQARNKRNSKYLTLNGESRTVADWADLYGINQNRINGRLMDGWSIEDAITKPIQKNKISKIYRHGTIE